MMSPAKPRNILALLIFVLGFVLVGPTPAALGQTGASGDPDAEAGQGAISITAEEAVDLALNNSRQLQLLETNVQIQASRSRSVDWLNNPEVRVRDLTTRNVHEQFDELQIGLRWSPPGLGEPSEEKQQDQVRLWERKVEAARAKDWLASRVRRACADVIMYRELVRIAQTRVDNEIKRISQIQTMMNLGRRTIVYYTKSKMFVTDAKNQYTRNLNNLREEQRRLQRLTGASDRIDVVPEPLPKVDLTLEQLLMIAYANRSEVPFVEQRKLLAAKQYNLERLRLVPWVSFFEVSHHIESNMDDWQELRLGVEIPLFNWNMGNIRATRLGISGKENQSLAIQERIEDEVRETWSAYNGALLAWNLSHTDGQIMIRNVSRIIADAIVARTVPPDEVLELERTIMDTQVILSQKRRELAHALSFLYYALGIRKPEQLTAKITNDGN